MAELDTNFVDAVLSANMNGKKRVRLTQIAENEYIVEDITEYEKVGSEYGQKEINTLNETVNGKVNKVEVIDDLDTVKAVTEDNVPVGCKAVTKFANDVNQSLTNENSETFNFGVKDGVRGFYTDPARADDSFVPFKQKKTYNPDNISYHSCKKNADYTSTYEITIVITFTFLSNVRVGTSILKGFQPPKIETEGFIVGGNNERYVVGINMYGEIYLKTGSSAGYYTSGYSWTICLGYDPA